MGWAISVALVAATFASMVWLLRAPRISWEVIGAALCLGIAGYVLQGRPSLEGKPRAPVQQVAAGDAGEVDERQRLGEGAAMGDKHLIIADALARRGQFADAAQILRGAVRQNPDNAEAWLAMANALVGHAEGTISPAATYAYERAGRAEPDSPGPPFFQGLALIRSGEFARGRALWAELLRQSPSDAPWRKDLEMRIAELDAFLANRAADRLPPR